MLLLIFIFFSSLIGTFLGVMSGGGSSMISLPLFLWAGIPLPLALATHKLYGIFAAPLAAYNYLKGRKVNWLFITIFSGMGLIGAYFGVQFVLTIDPKIMKKIMGTIIFIFVFLLLIKRQFGLSQIPNVSKNKKIFAYTMAPIMGFYEGLLGSGNGLLFTILTAYGRGFDLISALGYYSAVVFPWVTFSAIIYMQKGYFDFWIMLVAVFGAMIGSYLGSKYAKYKGNKFIKTVSIIIGALLGIKLILGI